MFMEPFDQGNTGHHTSAKRESLPVNLSSDPMDHIRFLCCGHIGCRLNQGRFHWAGVRHGSEMELDTEQLHALVLGLPWQRAGSGSLITLLDGRQ